MNQEVEMLWDARDFLKALERFDAPTILVNFPGFEIVHAAMLCSAAERFGELRLDVGPACMPTGAWDFLRALAVPVVVRFHQRWVAERLPPHADVILLSEEALPDLRAPRMLKVHCFGPPVLGPNLDTLREVRVPSVWEPQLFIDWAARHPHLEVFEMRGVLYPAHNHGSIDSLVRANRLRVIVTPRAVLHTPMLLADNTVLQELRCGAVRIGGALRFNCHLLVAELDRIPVGEELLREYHGAYRRCAQAAATLAGITRRALGRDASRLVARAMRTTLAEDEWLETK